MAASWACALDYALPKLTVVQDKIAKTRELVEQSGHLVIQVPTVAQFDLTYQVGHRSLAEQPDKLALPPASRATQPGALRPVHRRDRRRVGRCPCVP
jgi:flavin reductase (DIM6/NTAB) family NADH-FMN oxidoreductase RutF